MKKILLTLIISTIVIHCFAQRKKAEKVYKELGYKASIPLFESKNKLSLEDMVKIANAYRLNHDVHNAELWYSQVVQESNEPIHFLYYAQALHSNKKYDLAKEYYLLYDEKMGGDQDKRGANLANAIDRIKELRHTQSEIKNESAINSEKLEFSPAFYKNGIVFVSTKMPSAGNKQPKESEEELDLWINDYFMSLYYASRNEDNVLGESELFSSNISTKYHEGPVCFDKSGDRIFFSRNHYNNGKKKTDKKGILKMNIYSAIKSGDDWVNVRELPWNTEQYDEVHPALSADGTSLYFASNREGGLGGMDIYRSDFKAGEWSEPINLGDKINTPGNEIFPFVHDDGTLYFASDGWGGFGGLDIFSTAEQADATWEHPINIGTPFNSPKDDFGFILNTTGTEGYLSSAREGGSGKDDIYSFKIIDKNELGRKVQVRICVYDKATNERISNAKVTISQQQINKDKEIDDLSIRLKETAVKNEYILKLARDGDLPNNEKDIEKITDENGEFTLEAFAKQHYYFVVEKEGYGPVEYPLFIDSETQNQSERCIPLEKRNCLALKGVAINQQYEQFVPNVKVTLVNLCDGSEMETYTNANGKYSFPCIKCDCDYEIKGQKANFKTAFQTKSTRNIDCGDGSVLNANLLMILGQDKQTNSDLATTFQTKENQPNLSPFDAELKVGQVIELEKIYYDFDKYYIREGAQQSLEDVVALMTKYPSLVIELSSHTDSRGTRNYNQWLSRKRAKSAAEYIINRGIDAWRLQPKGYGESRLRNNCSDGVDCTEEAHQYNRRTEIRILEFDRSDIPVRYINNKPERIDSKQ